MVWSLEFFALANGALIARWFVLILLVPFIMFQADKALGAQAALCPGPIRAVFFMLMVIHGFSLGERFLTDWTIHARGSDDWYKICLRGFVSRFWADASPTRIPDLFKKADARSRKITPLLINPQFFFLSWENHESAVLMTSCYII